MSTPAERLEATPPIGGLTLREAAKLYQVSIRAVERARRIQERGIPEIVEMVEAGRLKLGPAERIALLSHERQREIVAGGPEAVRRAGRQLAGPRPATVDGSVLVALLDRALHDLSHGWHEAAADALGRARALLVEEAT